MKSLFKATPLHVHLCTKKPKGLELQCLGSVDFFFLIFFKFIVVPLNKCCQKVFSTFFSGFAHSFLLVWQVQRSLPNINFLTNFHASVCIEFFQQDVPYFPKFPDNRTLTLLELFALHTRCICSKRFFWVTQDGVRGKESG